MSQSDSSSSHIYLVGYRGCGKTSVARALSERLNRAWVDTDDLIENTAGKSIAEIFESEGEASFRDRETEAVRGVTGTADSKSTSQQIVALGGGAVLREENRQLISAGGVAIWLDASPEAVAKRIELDVTSGSRRPSLTGRPVLEEVREVMEARESIYREVGQLRIDTTSKTIESIVEEILQWM